MLSSVKTESFTDHFIIFNKTIKFGSETHTQKCHQRQCLYEYFYALHDPENIWNEIENTNETRERKSVKSTKIP